MGKEHAMRKMLLLVCCMVLTSAHAEAFKCVSPAGKLIFSDLPCEDGEKFLEIRQSESVQNVEAARLEVKRQKGVADKAAAENEAARHSTAGVASLPDESAPAPAYQDLDFPERGSGGVGPSGPLPTGMPQMRHN